MDVAVPPVTIEAASYLVSGTPTTEVFLIRDGSGQSSAWAEVADRIATANTQLHEGALIRRALDLPIPVATQQITLY